MVRHSFPLVAAVTLSGGQLAYAEESAGWLARVKNEVVETWQEGTPELYLPLHTEHLRGYYTREKIDSYQETPWGFGYGHGRFDANGNWHGVYAMGFQDSHYKPEWLAGYGWKTYWNLAAGAKLGLGYTAGLTTRSDIGHYTPVPLVLPIGSLDYRDVSLETTYVPGGRGYGNIFFFSAKWRLGR
ncbi:MAG: lipid IV(A) palmitoyltransferase PagP [Rugosibacter sp.]|nr:lipid IV(A) palmitoyltransferase PagP [Rugosibacter sp.]